MTWKPLLRRVSGFSAGTSWSRQLPFPSKEELDRFCEALIRIRDEIRAIDEGRMEAEDNPLTHAPHTAIEIARDQEAIQLVLPAPAGGAALPTHVAARQSGRFPIDLNVSSRVKMSLTGRAVCLARSAAMMSNLPTPSLLPKPPPM